MTYKFNRETILDKTEVQCSETVLKEIDINVYLKIQIQNLHCKNFIKGGENTQ